MKIVINDCFGGFSLSIAGVKRYAEIKGIEVYPYEMALMVDENKPLKPYAGDDNMWVSWATKEVKTREELNNNYFSERDIKRTDPALIQLVEELGEKADGRCASLKVIEIPDGIEYEIEEYDGNETVAEKHRTWG